MLPRPPALPPVSKNGTRSHQRSVLWPLPGISAEFVWQNQNDTAVDTFVLSNFVDSVDPMESGSLIQ